MSKERSRNRAWLLAGLALAAGVGLATLLERPRVRLTPESRILLLGDSHAQGLDPHLRAYAKEAGYPYGSAFKVGSTIAYWKGQRLAQALEAHKPTLAVVVLGTNDLAGKRSAQTVEADAAELLAELAQVPRPDLGFCLGADVLWVSPLALFASGAPGPFHALAVAVSGYGGCGQAEFFDSAALDVRTGPDLIHATAAGYASWAGAIWKRLS